MKLKITRDTYISFSIIIMIFSSYLSKHTTGVISSFFDNYDEIFAILIFLYSLLKIKNIKIKKKLMILQFAFISIGLIGTIINKLQPLEFVVKDLINCSKFINTIIGIITLYYIKDSKNVIVSLQKKIIFIVIIFFSLTVLDFIIHPSFLIHSSKSYGLYDLSLIYYHPAVLAQVLVLFISILSFQYPGVNARKICIKMCLIMLILTFVTKAIGFAFVYAFINNYKKIFKYKLFGFISIIIIASGTIYLGYDSIKMYYGTMENTARGKLTLGSLEIANDYFPYGGGLATYGSSSAIEHYSTLYVKLGFQKVYGLGYLNTRYATDTFWPIVIGEFGYVGLVVFLMIVFELLKVLINFIKSRSLYMIPYTSLLIYLIICSTSSTSFFNPIAVPYGIILGICIVENLKNNCNN